MREDTIRGRPPPPTPPSQPSLGLHEPDLDHLSQAPEPLVRAILMTLCDDERVKAKALRYFDRLLRFEEAQEEGGPVDATVRSPTSGVPTTKNPRKRQKTGDPKICVQCDGIFLEEENSFGVCRYHAGVMQLFDETKIHIDWDTADIDDVDTEATRADFPDAFRWLCCDVAGSRPGCRRGRHEANPELSRKGRESASQESSLDRDPLHLDEAVGSQAGTEVGLLGEDHGHGYSDVSDGEEEEEDEKQEATLHQTVMSREEPQLRGRIALPRRSASKDGREVGHQRRLHGGEGGRSPGCIAAVASVGRCLGNTSTSSSNSRKEA